MGNPLGPHKSKFFQTTYLDFSLFVPVSLHRPSPGSSPLTGCLQPLGLSSSLLPDSSLTSSLAASLPHHARLHHPSSAWCFSSRLMEEQGQEDVSLEVSLPAATLLSGLQSQGPPRHMQGKVTTSPSPLPSLPQDYMRYISLTVEVWTAAGWQDCCSRDRGRTQFYADDKVDEEGEVSR